MNFSGQSSSSCIALRLITDGSADIAYAAWLQIRDRIAELAAPDEPAIKRYSKFQGAQEISCTIRPSRDIDHVYEEVARRLASGWSEHSNDQFARWIVWNKGSGVFAVATVRWAHLELIRAL
jgi:hypothetical protein